MPYSYSRRRTHAVAVGRTAIGGANPVRVQSMTSTRTMDTAASVAQTMGIAEAGGEIVRLTAQGVREAENLGEIRRALRERGCEVPLVADIHFNPRAAMVAAGNVEKVRINPGNFVDPGRTFVHLEYSDEEYGREMERLEGAFVPLLEECRKHGTALRIGVNHGSLSDRIMSRYGDTPAGMVESAMEFLRVAVKHQFYDIVISIKASNTVVMTQTVELLAREMEREGMDFPLHLGVTEAGDGDDGRIRSAVGIGSLLMEGLGDTIRVSLSEAPEREIPVARELLAHVGAAARERAGEGCMAACEIGERRAIGSVGGGNVPVVVGYDDLTESPLLTVEATDPQLLILAKGNPGAVLRLESRSAGAAYDIANAVEAMASYGLDNPVVAAIDYTGAIERTPGEAAVSREQKVAIRGGADMGFLLLRGMADGIELRCEGVAEEKLQEIALGILQATRRRVSRTEFVSCPGCGRTMFDLQSTVKRVKEALGGYPGLKIAVMGCIVNGPGEMADADYGYVGAAAGRVSLYRGKECVEKNIPSEEAVERLMALLRADGKIAAEGEDKK